MDGKRSRQESEEEEEGGGECVRRLEGSWDVLLALACITSITKQ